MSGSWSWFRHGGAPLAAALLMAGCNGLSQGTLYLTGLDTMGQDLSEARTWLAAANRGGRGSQRLLAELDRAQAGERDYARRLQLLSTQTAACWASEAYAAYWWRPYGHFRWY